MKRKREQYEPVPMDGWCVLRPGEWVSFHVDTAISLGIDELRGRMIQIRRAFLSETFNLENELIQLQLMEEFGVNGRETRPRDFADRDLELRSEYSFEKKTKRIQPIVRRLRDKSAADRLVQHLADCRVVRNLMAHYPCWLAGVNDDAKHRTVAFGLFIGDKSHVWEIDDADVIGWRTIFLETRRELIRLRHEIGGLPLPSFVEGSTVTTSPTP